MTISWVDQDGQTGIAENAYEFQMQVRTQPGTPEAKTNTTKRPADIDLRTPSERNTDVFHQLDHPSIMPQRGKLDDWIAPARQGPNTLDTGEIPTFNPDVPSNTPVIHPRDYLFEDDLNDTYVNRDDQVDKNQTKLADVIHDLRVKWMGDPDKWSTKEEVGNFINQAMSVMGGGFKINNKTPLPNVTVKTPTIERWAKYEEMSAQGKTTKQILKSTKLEPETVRDALGRDNLAIAAFNSENALTTAYFKSLEGLDPALQKALKNQVSVKDLKRYTRNLPEEQLKSIFEELPVSVKESFQSGEARRANIDAGKKTKIIAKPLKE